MSGDLPEFDIPHSEKIEWMIETHGWALEPVAARHDTSPPVPTYSYTLGFPTTFQMSDVVIVGLTPIAARGLLDMIAEIARSGTEIPPDVALTGVLDNDLRCMFVVVDQERWGHLFATAASWYPGGVFSMLQMLWPDRNGSLPNESNFEQRLHFAQPVLGVL